MYAACIRSLVWSQLKAEVRLLHTRFDKMTTDEGRYNVIQAARWRTCVRRVHAVCSRDTSSLRSTRTSTRPTSTVCVASRWIDRPPGSDLRSMIWRWRRSTDAVRPTGSCCGREANLRCFYAPPCITFLYILIYVRIGLITESNIIDSINLQACDNSI